MKNTKIIGLLILLAFIPSCTANKYKYAFANYIPTIPESVILMDGLYIELACGVGWPKSHKTSKNGEYIIETMVAKDEREDPANLNYVDHVNIILFARDTEIMRQTVDGETYNNAIIKQKDSYKKYITKLPIIEGMVFLSDSTIGAIPNSFLYRYKKSDFKTSYKFDLAQVFFENYDDEIFIEFYQKNEHDSSFIIAQYSWHLKFTTNNQEFYLSDFKYESNVHNYGYHEKQQDK